MTDLRSKMEAELNSIAEKRISILSDATITAQKKYLLVSDLNIRQTTIRQLLQNYITLHNKFKELQGQFSINY